MNLLVVTLQRQVDMCKSVVVTLLVSNGSQERERERERQTDRQTTSDTRKQTDRQTDRQSEHVMLLGQTDRQTDRANV